MTTARADRREPRLEHHHDPKGAAGGSRSPPTPSWSSSRCGLIPWVVLGAQCPQREETRYWTPAVRRIRTTERIRTNEADAYAWGILRSSAVVAGVSRWRRRSPGRPVANLRDRSRSSPQEEVQNDRPDDGDEEHESYRDEYRHVVGPPRERPRNAIDAEAWRGPAHPARGSPGRPQLRAESCPQSPRDEATGTTCLGTDRSRYSFPPPAMCSGTGASSPGVPSRTRTTSLFRARARAREGSFRAVVQHV